MHVRIRVRMHVRMCVFVGLRALKASLVAGGKLILSNKGAGVEVKDVLEADLLVKSLCVNTLR